MVGFSYILRSSVTDTYSVKLKLGGSIGAGLFVGSGTAFHNGGPASVVSLPRILLPAFHHTASLTRGTQILGFIIVGFMLLFTVQALGELAVLYPVGGAFFTYAVRFLDPSWYLLQPLLL